MWKRIKISPTYVFTYLFILSNHNSFIILLPFLSLPTKRVDPLSLTHTYTFRFTSYMNASEPIKKRKEKADMKNAIRATSI